MYPPLRRSQGGVACPRSPGARGTAAFLTHSIAGGTGPSFWMKFSVLPPSRSSYSRTLAQGSGSASGREGHCPTPVRPMRPAGHVPARHSLPNSRLVRGGEAAMGAGGGPFDAMLAAPRRAAVPSPPLPKRQAPSQPNHAGIRMAIGGIRPVAALIRAEASTVYIAVTIKARPHKDLGLCNNRVSACGHGSTW